MSLRINIFHPDPMARRTFRAGESGEFVRVVHVSTHDGAVLVALQADNEPGTFIGVAPGQEFICPDGYLNVVGSIGGASVQGRTHVRYFEITPRKGRWGLHTRVLLDMRWHDRAWNRITMPFGNLVAGQRLQLA